MSDESDIEKADTLLEKELRRMIRVSSMQMSAQSVLRDRYALYASFLEGTILVASVWLTAIALIDRAMLDTIIPFDISANIWIGLSSVLVFSAVVLQVRFNPRSKSAKHHESRALHYYAYRKAYAVLDSDELNKEETFKRVSAIYEMVDMMTLPIPEKEFLNLKKYHLTKLVCSRYLDRHPGASLSILKFRIWYKSTFTGGPLI